MDPAMALQYIWHGPTIHLTWSFIYWLYFCILYNKNGIKDVWGHKRLPSLGLGPALVLQWTLSWPYITPNMALYILAIFLHYMRQNWDKGTLVTQRSTLIGSRTCLGPSMDPAMALLYTQHGPLYIGYILHSMQQKWDQGTLGTERSTLIRSRTRLGPSMDPAMALQYTSHGPLYIGYVLHYMQQKWGQGTLGTQRLTLIGSRTRLGPSMDPAMALQYTSHGSLYIGFILHSLQKKMGSWDSGDTKVDPHLV